MIYVLLVIALAACCVAGWSLGRMTASRLWDR